MTNKSLPVLLACTPLLLVGCSQDDAPKPAEKPAGEQTESFGGGVGRSYNEMLDEARQSVNQTNQQMQDTEQRIRDAR